VDLRGETDAVEKMSRVVAGKRVMIPNLYTIKCRGDREGEIDKKIYKRTPR